MESMGCKDAKKTFFVKTAMYKVNFFFVPDLSEKSLVFTLEKENCASKAFTIYFFFQGNVVAVKKIDKSKFNLNRNLLIELKKVRNYVSMLDARHTFYLIIQKLKINQKLS